MRPSYTSRQSSTCPLHRMQTAPEEERLGHNTPSLCLNQFGFNTLFLTPTPTSCEQFPFLHGTSLPLPEQSSHHLSRECHHPSTFRFKPLPPFPQRTSRSSQMVRFEMETPTAVQVWYSLAKMTSSTSGMLPQAPIVAASRQRRPPSKKPSNGCPSFHHGPSYHHLRMQITFSGRQQRYLS